MWQLIKVSAQNVCSFKEMEYTIHQGCTTLVFGHNLDNDSQGSNGSGKSALIESIAIGLTGNSLRKVKSEEIINDYEDEAEIRLELDNDELHQRFIVVRKFSRSSAQEIQTILNGENVVCATVNDYNKYILDMIGLSQDDIFSSFILSRHKYVSFLNASDSAKKELINRFSNGMLVDESIELLKADMASVSDRLSEAEKEVSMASGKCMAINDQIASFNTEKEERAIRRAEMINGHREAIGRLREKIRNAQENIDSRKAALDSLDEMDEQFSKMEESQTSFHDCLERVTAMLGKQGLSMNIDFASRIEYLNRQMGEYDRKIADCRNVISTSDKDLQKLQDSLSELEDDLLRQTSVGDFEIQKINGEIQSIKDGMAALEQDKDKAYANIADILSRKNEIQNMLRASITCPNCKHEFVLQSDRTIDELKEDYAALERREVKGRSAIKRSDAAIEEANASIRNGMARRVEISESLDGFKEKVRKARQEVQTQQTVLRSHQSELSSLLTYASRIETSYGNLRGTLFDTAFDVLDRKVEALNGEIESYNQIISNSNNTITSYEESVRQLEEMTDEVALEGLNNQKAKYDAILNLKISEKETIEAELAEYKRQETRFIDFKTHLANSKVEALGALTNEFLEAIGSDIRIQFSGFTVLKNNKVREKISSSVLRDGVDGGSFAKYSAGEQARVNLASVLALHKLMNVTCSEGKGLDLLILDEILDATDENGLANMFDALNSLQVTTLVVSHGKVAEAYPYRLTVTKRNGVSTINEQER